MQAVAQDTAFTYQGQLASSGQPATGSYDLQARLFNAEADGVQVGPVVVKLAVTVTGGFFTTSLDFGPGVFDGAARWLELAVRPAGGAGYTSLAPRQPLAAAPYALYAMTPAGPKGDTGATGAPGPEGAPGPVGLTWREDWSEKTAYSPGDAVLFKGSSYIAKSENFGKSPSDGKSDWSLLAQQGETGLRGPAGPPGPSSADWSLTGNTGTDPTLNFIGTTDAAALVLRAGNQPVVRFEGQPDGLRIIGGRDNSIDPRSTNSAILSGRMCTVAEAAHESVIVGGLQNQIRLDQRSAFIGGGARNEIRQDNQHAVIVGGRDNSIGTNTVISLVVGGAENRIANNVDGGLMVGGFRNDILGSPNPNRREIAPVLVGGSDNEIGRESSWAVILGGDNNRIGTNCPSAIVVGGTNNLVADNCGFSLAAGRRSRVNHQGAFVFADSQNASFGSAGSDTFNIRASGGIHANADTSMFFGSTTRQMLNLWDDNYGVGVQSSTLYFRSDSNFSWFRGGTHSNTANAPGTGGTEMMRLNSAGLRVNGTFVSSSDRNQKEAFAPVEPREVLEKVAALPLSEWNYKQDPTSRHIGPMAQDFHAAFGVGPDDRHIATVDADGVALAAIQGLNQKVEEQATALREREAQIARLESELSELRSLVLRSFNPPAARQP